MNSSFLNLNWKDVGKSLIVFFLTTIISGIVSYSSNGAFPASWTAFKPILIASASATLAYLVKNFLTNSTGQFVTSDTNTQK